MVADGTSAPGVSSLNPGPGERTAIAVTSGLSSGRVRVVSTQVVDVELFAVGVYVTSITPTITAVSGVGPGVLGFDPLGRLTSTTTGGVTVGYSYLADGTRVAARTQGGGEVYYLGGIEATRTSGVWSQVRRTYPYAGVTIASRTSTATGTGVSWLLGDRQGSVTTTITTGAVSTRWYRPYGAARGPSPASPVVTTGFLGKHEDPSGLTHLDHRDYDPTTGTFITIDPLVATTGEPYQYATGNPTTLSDPNGLEPCPKTGCSADDSGGRAPCARSAYSNPMGTGACVPNSASYNAMLKYDEWSACVKQAAGCPATIPVPPEMPPMDLGDTARLWEDILTGFDKGAEGGGLMFCGGIEGSIGVASASAMTCEIVDTDGLAGLTTVGAGPSVGTPGLSGSAGGAISNADAADLAGWALCGTATGGAVAGGTGSLCGSISVRDGEWSYLGAWTFYVGVTVTSPQASAGYAYTYTWVDRWLKWPWA